jgi:hypothetical protein
MKYYGIFLDDRDAKQHKRAREKGRETTVQKRDRNYGQLRLISGV